MADVEIDFTGDLSSVFAELTALRGNMATIAKAQDNINGKFTEMARKGQQATSQLTQNANQAAQAIAKQNGAYQKELGLIGSNIAKLTALTAARDRSNNTTAIDRFNKKIAETQKEIDKLTGKQRQLTTATSHAASWVKTQTSAFEGLRNAAAAYLGLNFLQTQAADVVTTTAKFQSYNRALEFIAGGTKEAAAETEFIRATVNRFGLELESATSSYVKFAGAARISGLSAQETQETFTNVSASVSAFGLSAEDAQGVFLALSQIIGKGTVQAEELRGQIGERIPGAFKIAADAIGVTEAELNKLLENGQVLSKDFLPAFSRELGNRFVGAADAAGKATNNLNRDLNNAKNAITDFKLEVGNANGGLISGLISLVTIDNIRLLVSIITAAVTTFAVYKTTLIAARVLTIAYNAANIIATTGVKGLDFVMKGFNLTLKASPLGVFTALLSAAAGAFALFSLQSGGAKDDVDSLTESFDANTVAINNNLKALTAVSEANTGSTKSQLQTSADEAQALIDKLRQLLGIQKKVLIEGGLIYGAQAQSFLESDAPAGFIIDANRAKELTKIASQTQGLNQDIFETADQLNNATVSLLQLQKQLKTAAENNVNYSKLSIEALEKLADAGDKLARAELKIRKEAEENYKQRLKNFQDLQEKLKDARDKAVLDLAKNGEEAAILERDFGLQSIAELEKQFLAAKAAAGKGSKLSLEEEDFFNTLRLNNQRKFAEDMYKVVQDQEKAFATVIIDEKAKQKRDFEIDLNARVDALRKAGVQELSILEYVANESKKFDSAVKLDELANEESHQLALNETLDRSQLSEKKATEDFERNKLEIQIKYAQLRLKLLQETPGADSKEIDSLTVTINDLKKQLGQIEVEAAKFDIFEALGLTLKEDEKSKVIGAFKDMYSQITSIATSSLEDQARINEEIVSRLDTAIGETQTKITQALELNKQGLANNLDEEKANLKKLEEERKKALNNQRKLAREKAALETVTQAISLVSASANIFASLSAIPFVGVPLAIGAIATMLAAFVATRAKASALASQIPTFAEGGVLPGPAHREGGLHIIDSRSGRKVAEAEGDEFITRVSSTKKYRGALEAINNNRPGEAARLLLKSIGNRNFNLGEVVRDTRNVMELKQSATQSNSSVDLGTLEILVKEGNDIARNEEKITAVGDYLIIKKGNTTRKIKIK